MNQDKVDPAVIQEALDLLDHLERRENMEMRDDLVKLVPKDHPGRRVTGECQACQGCRVIKDIGDCPELREQEETPDHQDHGDPMATLVCLDFQDLWVHLVCQVSVARTGKRGPRVTEVLMVWRDHLDQVVPWVHLGCRDLQDNRERREIRVQRDHLVAQGVQDQVGKMDRLDLQERLENQVHLEVQG